LFRRDRGDRGLANPGGELVIQLHCGDCLDWLRTLDAGSVDAVVTDPPYPEIDRAYGRWTEAEWWELMMGVCAEVRRVLAPGGSAVFILQPNSRKVGSMRGWLWRFMAWACDEWNMVQDAWWWNTCTMPGAHAIQGRLMRTSLKACVWCGPADCFRDQSQVLMQSDNFWTRRKWDLAQEGREEYPSGQGREVQRMIDAVKRRGGSTPFNVLPMGNGSRHDMAGMHGHGAGTPLNLASWWTRYITPPDGVVCDPFMGSGTMGIAALKLGRSIVGCERDPGYFAIAQRRIAAEQARHPLFAVT
jgi:DNA modification methylase